MLSGEAVENGEIEIRGFSAECVEPASYDLRVGEEAYTTSSAEVVNVREQGEVRIAPGEFALVLTHEYLKLSNSFLGRLGLRSSQARRGLLPTIGPQVDPGFEGKLVIGLVSFIPDTVTLAYLEKLCTLELQRLDPPARQGYRGPYQKQDHLTEHTVSQLPQEALPLASMFFAQLAARLPADARGIWGRPRPVVPARRLGEARHTKFRQERRAFEELKPDLLKTDRGKYVVVHNGKVVLRGRDEAELAKQAYKMFGYVELYIGLVEEGVPAVHIPSPRLEGRDW